LAAAAVCLTFLGLFLWSLIPNNHLVAHILALTPSASGGAGKPVPNFKVEVTAPDGTVVARTQTDQNGIASFNLAKKDKDRIFSVTFPDDQSHRLFSYQWQEKPFKCDLNARH